MPSLSVYTTYSLLVGVSLLSSLTLLTPSLSANTEDGVFGDYFRNIITTPCNPGYIITGFDQSATLSYGTRTCTSIATVLAQFPGNVGIGTATPTAKLEVAGNLKANNVVYGDNSTKTTLVGNLNALLPSGFYNSNNALGEPFANSWWHTITNRHSNESNQYEFQLISNFWNGGKDTYLRTIQDGGVQPWRQVITAEPNSMVSIGNTTQNYLPASGNWNYTLQLNAQDTSSIGFHDASQNVGSIRFNNNLFTIGADDGWGVANTYLAGNVGIGTSSPTAKLEVAGNLKVTNGLDVGNANGTYTYITLKDDESPNGVKYIHANSNNIGFLGGNGTWLTRWDEGGNQVNTNSITAGGNVTAAAFLYSSDRRLKTNITPLSNSLQKILTLNGYSFDWKSTGKADMGVIAQEVEKVFPAIVATNDKTGMKSVEYGNLVAPIIEALKEIVVKQNGQDKEIQDLKRESKKLQDVVQVLSKK